VNAQGPEGILVPLIAFVALAVWVAGGKVAIRYLVARNIDEKITPIYYVPGILFAPFLVAAVASLQSACLCSKRCARAQLEHGSRGLAWLYSSVTEDDHHARRQVPARRGHVRCPRHSGPNLLEMRITGFDPERTSTIAAPRPKVARE
jgi:hypothetical protein